MKDNKSIYRALLFLGLPLVGGNIAQFSLTIVDTAMLGHYNHTALAASVVSGALFFSLFIVGSGFSFAVMPVISAYDARGEDNNVRRSTRMALWLSISYAVLVFPFLFWSKPILGFLGQSDNISTLGQEYLRIMGVAMLPALLDITLRNYLTGLKHTNIVLWATLLGLAFKFFFGWLLVFGKWGFPQMGIQGAALSTIGVHTLIFSIFVIYINRHFSRHNLFKNFFCLDKAAMNKLIKLGVPIGLTYLTESSLFSGTAVMMGWLGTTQLAAHGIAIQLAAITFMVHLGVSQAATTLTGNAVGNNEKPETFRRIGYVTLSVTFGVAFLVIAIFLSFPTALLSFFLDPNIEARDSILIIGLKLITIAAIFQLVDGLQAVGLALLRGLQDVRIPFCYAALSYWGVGMTASYILGFRLGFGELGVWTGLVAGLSTAAISLLVRYFNKTR
ncbi:MAG: MATE family efflux transporter [Pseudomonadota bacterium]|nr:MATE family efflux transporter [Pseudomonadota bacterium]